MTIIKFISIVVKTKVNFKRYMNKELTIASVLELARLTAWVMTDVVFLFAILI